MSVYFDHISQVDRQNMSVLNIMNAYGDRECEKRHVAIYGSLAVINEPSWMVFSHMLSVELSMRTLKYDNWHFRLIQKRIGYPVKLVYHHKKHNYCFRFKDHLNLRYITVQDALVKLTSMSTFAGFNYFEAEPIIKINTVKETILVNDLQNYSSLDLLNEIERRYKNEVPDWYKYNNPEDKYIEQKKLA